MNDDRVQADPTLEPDGGPDFPEHCGTSDDTDDRARLAIGHPFSGRLGFSRDIDAIEVEFDEDSLGLGYRVSLRNHDNEQISAGEFYIGMVHPEKMGPGGNYRIFVSYPYLTNWVTERNSLFIIPEQTGTYCVEIQAKSAHFTGDYTILVDEGVDPLAGATEGDESTIHPYDAVEGMPSSGERFHSISVGTNQAIVGTIEEPQDKDWYITQLANGIYRVTIEGHGTGMGTLRGPGLMVRQSDAREFLWEEGDSSYDPSRWVSEFKIDDETSGSDNFHLEVWSLKATPGRIG